MRQHAVKATVKFDDKRYGRTIQVEGPDTLEEFLKKHGESGVTAILTKSFIFEEAAILRDRIARKIGKVKTGNLKDDVTEVDLD